MTVRISFEGSDAAAIRAEALAFFNAQPAEYKPQPAASQDVTEPSGDDKDALVARAKELGVDGVSKRWGVDKLKAAIEEAAAAAPVPDDQEDDPFGLDDDELAADEKVTLEQVRDALKSYQAALKQSLIDGGADEAEAKSESMNKARGLLSKVGGTDKLGGLEESKFATVVKAAEAATDKL